MTSTLVRPVSAAPAPVSSRRVILATVALVLGGFAIGTTEFVTMGLLPEIAGGVHASIPQAGHAISAYALGVVVGAPLIAVLGAHLPRRALLLALMAVFAIGNVASALAPTYGILIATRLLSGLPHGAFFGVASLVAVDMAPPGRRGRAVGRVMLGIPVANVVGVPAATWLGQHAGWRAAYLLVGVLGLLTVALITVFVPRTGRDGGAAVRRELAAFGRLQVWLTLLVGAVGFGGMFAMYSYIAPTVTDVTGLSGRAVPVFLLAFGVGGIGGTWLGGRLADWSVLRSLVLAMAALGVLLAAFTVSAYAAVAAVLTVLAIAGAGSILAINLQVRLMTVAGEARTLGAASNHAALNMANALGAWLGGLVIGAGYALTATSWVGVGLAGVGLVVLGLSVAVHRAEVRRRAGR